MQGVRKVLRDPRLRAAHDQVDRARDALWEVLLQDGEEPIEPYKRALERALDHLGRVCREVEEESPRPLPSSRVRRPTLRISRRASGPVS